MDPLEKATRQLQEALKECFEEIRFARAAELARSRRYLEAEGLLSPNGRESSVPKELDLLARISAQQRKYGRARRLWGAALQQSPGNAAYERAIERAKAAEHFQALRKRVTIALLALAVVALVVAAAAFFSRRSPTAGREVEKLPDIYANTTLHSAPAIGATQPAPVALPPAPSTPQAATPPATPPSAAPQPPLGASQSQ